MSKSPNARRVGGPLSWDQLARPDTEQCQRFLAESLSLLLADLLRSVLSDASPALPAEESAVARYRNLADSLAGGESRRPTRTRSTPPGPPADPPPPRGDAPRCPSLGPVPGPFRRRALAPSPPVLASLAPHSRQA